MLNNWDAILWLYFKCLFLFINIAFITDDDAAISNCQVSKCSYIAGFSDFSVRFLWDQNCLIVQKRILGLHHYTKIFYMSKCSLFSVMISKVRKFARLTTNSLVIFLNIVKIWHYSTFCRNLLPLTLHTKFTKFWLKSVNHSCRHLIWCPSNSIVT